MISREIQEILARDEGRDAYLGVQNLVDLCHERARAAGWWNDLKSNQPLHRNKAESIALMHSELSEMLEGVRKGLADDHCPHFSAEEVELADVLIRAFDYAGGHGLRLAEAFEAKLEYNRTRADHKRENRAKPGGKAI